MNIKRKLYEVLPAPVQILLYTVIVCAIFHCTCSLSPFAGSGTEEGNVVSGIIIDENNQPSPNTQVLLLPHDYDPYKGLPIPKSFIDTTNAFGQYVFIISDTGTYNILAFNPSQQTSALVAGIDIEGDTTIVQTGILREQGSVKVFLPDSADSVNGYVYIPGTTIAEPLGGNTVSVIVDSVPAGLIPSVYYASVSGTPPQPIRYDITVIPNEVATITMPTWMYSVRLFLNTTASGADVSGTVTDFPVLVRLSSGNFDFSEALAEGEDIRFAKPDNTMLPYEIEYWNAAEQKAAIWVKVDTVYGNNDTQHIIMAWGKSGVASTSNSTAVFDTATGFNAVWHLNTSCVDATTNNHNGTNYGATDTAGAIGHSMQFDGTDSIKVAGLLGSQESITLSAWVYLDTAACDNGEDIISLGDAVLMRADEMYNGTFGAFHGDTGFHQVGTGKRIAKTGWRYLTFSVDANTILQSFYIDGALDTTQNFPGPINYSGIGENTLIGAHANGETYHNFTGRIDEVRVCRRARSADWIKLSFINQKAQDALVEFR